MGLRTGLGLAWLSVGAGSDLYLVCDLYSCNYRFLIDGKMLGV